MPVTIIHNWFFGLFLGMEAQGYGRREKGKEDKRNKVISDITYMGAKRGGDRGDQ